MFSFSSILRFFGVSFFFSSLFLFFRGGFSSFSSEWTSALTTGPSPVISARNASIGWERWKHTRRHALMTGHTPVASARLYKMEKVTKSSAPEGAYVSIVYGAAVVEEDIKQALEVLKEY